MRCFLKRTVILSAFSLFLLFVIKNLHEGNEDFNTNEEEKRLGREIALNQLYSIRNVHNFLELWNASSVMNVSYQYLAGIPPLKKKYLTIGLSSVKRQRGNYLQETLKSIFKQSTNEELKDMVVVVHLADFDVEWNSRTAQEISSKFVHYIISGHLLIIHAPEKNYPPLTGLKRNFNDPPNRVTFRSKQNIDYAFLLNFCASLSDYYIMIEDDVYCAKSFFTAIKKAVASREGSYWVTLEFSKLGYIGKLYHSRELPRLAQFLFLFYQEMPCDWLLTHFRSLLTQNEVIRFRPSLFQHNGYYSSFQGTANKLKDDDFEGDSVDFPDNPPADIHTSITVFEQYAPHKAYSNVDGYFWGKSPRVNNHFTVMFIKPVNISHINIRTGTQERPNDILHSGKVEIGTKMTNKMCGDYISIGDLARGQFDQSGIEHLIKSPAECIRILVTNDQKEWVIIKSINVWTKKENIA
ncbi:alpha-1,3-mannosyl-glycoprotein 4-beta-N-acetylglucosaminyltransferase C-like [Protopterus annectens]|uniref:alpha-1,3-mannosyl-glycoprotein 4-beta-N-acetylglucosaminyltransferase C-like n=1 Tax=Protopterus annectens TaxID=7888 RepID=UPI001CFA384F|nr:alpha-1,3-mannosyl-glycoprotein 4-beta-N-acetylglucosaminyltransferase C-like [Protopterus annectens]XP_043932597.1 alpha-1,3-mannosyl-glycoprotein 4-beta-N-acetylglucosaminyltransferase C-like [Protopterus annectens]XP_043932598.1 alpha-1,3-mannosyl-glycoprotein 4-beta-N-acetylglucosaminyltransferase C-like [Protopterus annectens]